MFGHDKDEDEKKDDSNVIHPINTKPADEKLMGIADDEAKTVKEDKDEVDKDISDIVGDINASTDAEEKPSKEEAVNLANDDSDKEEAADLEVVAEEKPEPLSVSSDNSSHVKPSSELLQIKKSALQELSPLIDQLDQTPEEKTNTLLMMIQATDDQSLISTAFDSAKDIKDEKKRAQAMLDIINEINYFTQKKK